MSEWLQGRTLVFWDIEAGGLDKDTPIHQIGLVKFDSEMEFSEPPQECFGHLPVGSIVSAHAYNVTGLSPKQVNQQGVAQRECAEWFHSQVAVPGQDTASLMISYNGFSYDHPLIEMKLYQSFFDPYAYKWKGYAHGDNPRKSIPNESFDLYMMNLAAYAMGVKSIHFPENENGVSLRLEDLSVANGWEQENPHEAISDVYATAANFRHYLRNEPKFLDYCLKINKKAQAKELVRESKDTLNPLIHVDRFYGKDKAYGGVVLPLNYDNTNPNQLYLLDLNEQMDIQALSEMDEDGLLSVLYAKASEDPDADPAPRPLRTAKINQLWAHPYTVGQESPRRVLTDEKLARFGASHERIAENLIQVSENLEAYRKLAKKLADLPAPDFGITDRSVAIYDGFFSRNDQDKREKWAEKIHKNEFGQIFSFMFGMDDPLRNGVLYAHQEWMSGTELVLPKNPSADQALSLMLLEISIQYGQYQGQTLAQRNQQMREECAAIEDMDESLREQLNAHYDRNDEILTQIKQTLSPEVRQRARALLRSDQDLYIQVVKQIKQYYPEVYAPKPEASEPEPEQGAS